MLSLANAFSKENIDDFLKKIRNFLNLKNTEKIFFSAEPKIDGISASLKYIDGVFVLGLSRGDGKTGEDITNNLMTIKNIPKKIEKNNFPNLLDVRGEVYISKSDFKKINKQFANPRNAAGGSLRQKDPNETKKIPVKFVAYVFGIVDPNMVLTRPGRHLKTILEHVAPFCLNMSPWRAVAAPFVPQIVINCHFGGALNLAIWPHHPENDPSSWRSCLVQ